MTMQEDRIYDDRRSGVAAFVASEIGVVVVELAGAQIGRFRVDRRCTARDVGASEVVAVATDEDVFVYDPPGEGDGNAGADGDGDEDPGPGSDRDPYRPTGFGPAVAVGVDGDALVAASPDRRICRCVDGEWFELATIDHDVRAVDGNLVAAADGVYRANPDGLDHVGLDDGRDVAARGPYAATGDGLYELGNGWLTAREGAFDVVACAPDRERAHAASGATLYARGEDGWHATDAPADAPIAGVAHDPDPGDEESGTGTYAITGDGTVLARGTDEAGDVHWRTRNVGVREVAALAIPGR